MKFDGENKLIIMDNKENVLDVRIMYYNWKNWLSNPDNLKYPLALRYVGGDRIENNHLGITYFLINGWKIRPYESDHTLTIKGNIYSDDQTDIVVKTLGNYNVLVKNKVSNLIDFIPTKVYNNISTVSTQSSQNDDGDDDWTINN
jgi:hypothetical protein